MENTNFTSNNELDDYALLCCKFCNRLHSFKIYYDKKLFDLFLDFNCENNNEKITLSLFLSEINNYSIKCFKCNKLLKTNEEIYKTLENNFTCKNCSEDNFKLLNYLKLGELKLKSITEKINEILLTSKEKEIDNDLYKSSKEKILTLHSFLNIMFYNKLFVDLNEDFIEEREILSNFFQYFEQFVKIVLENKNYYDIFTIIKELFLPGIIYQYKFYYNESNTFMSFYFQLLNSRKNKLSFEMFEYLEKKYTNNYKYKTHYIYTINKYIQKREIDDSFVINTIIYNNIISYINNYLLNRQINFLYLEIEKLKHENYLNNYYQHFFLIPQNLITKRKGINFLLNEIINSEYKEFKSITPTQNFIKSIKKEIKFFINNDIDENLKLKLIEFNNKLLKEFCFLPTWKNKNKNSEIQNHPYVNFTFDEIKKLKTLKENYNIDNKQELKINKSNNLLLQITIDFLFYLKEKGNEFAHLIEITKLKYYKNIQIIKNYKNDNKNNLKESIENTFKINEVKQNFSLNEILKFVFEIFDNTILNENERVQFILNKYNKEFEIFSKSLDSYKNLEKSLKNSIEEIKNSIDELINSYTVKDEKLLQKYLKIFEMKNCYEDVIVYLNKFFQSKILKIKNDDYNYNNYNELLKYKQLINELNQYHKFQNFKNLYLNKLLNNKIKENKNSLLNEINEINKSILEINGLISNLDLIKTVLLNLKKISFNIEKIFNDFMEENYPSESNKKMKICENEDKKIHKISLNEIKEYIKTFVNTNKTIDFISEEPKEFLFQLFKLTIGYPL